MKDTFTVSGLNRYIRNLLDTDAALAHVMVQGEISNLKYHTSGHIYFTLKDAAGALPCVMFSGQRRSGLLFRMQEGMQVIVTGNVSVYERDGRYQLYARRIVQDGTGRLYQRYEELKKRLQEQGLFAPEGKKAIPAYPRRIGIVTAKTGAALQDMINIITRRDPYVQLVFCPAIVQGQDAAPSIADGLRRLDAYGVDTIIVGRGGGSIEDLWAFNEEIVARAIFACRTPVISAVGHETDVTIADFAADLRAPTPSAAAELAVPDIRQELARLSQMCERMDRILRDRLHLYRQYVGQYRLKLTNQSPENRIRQSRQCLMDMEEALQRCGGRVLEGKKHIRDLYMERLAGLSPLARLADGYACVCRENKSVVHSIGQVSTGDMVTICVRDGDIRAQVTQTRRVRRETVGGESDTGIGI